MKTAHDIMTTNPILFNEEDDLTEVTTRFLLSRISSAPVVDVREKPIGVLTETGLMKCFLMLYSKPANKIKLKDVVNLIDPATFVNLDDALEKVLRTMLTSKTSRVIVLGTSNRIVGVISPKDILKSLSEDLLQIKGVSDKLLKAATHVAYNSQASGADVSEDNLYKKFFENSPYMMHSVDAQGMVRMANKKTHRALGYEYPELVGKKMETLYLEKYWESARDGLHQARREGEFLKVNTSMLHKNGTSLPVEIQTTGLFDEKSKFLGTMSVVRSLDQDPSITSIMELIGIFDDKAENKSKK